jgi:hypothetical protein
MRLQPLLLALLIFAPTNTCFHIPSFISNGIQQVGNFIYTLRFRDRIEQAIWNFFTVTLPDMVWPNTNTQDDVLPPKVKVLPHPPNDFIVPREKELVWLKTLFDSFPDQNGGINVLYLFGLPATGKTEMARQYGNFEFHRNYTRTVVHLNMTSEEAFKKSLILDIIEIILETSSCNESSCGESLHKETITNLMEKLRRLLKKRQGWLLIIDDIKQQNITDYEMYKQLPQRGWDWWGTGRMLVTTQVLLADDDSTHVKTVRYVKQSEGLALPILAGENDMTLETHDESCHPVSNLSTSIGDIIYNSRALLGFRNSTSDFVTSLYFNNIFNTTCERLKLHCGSDLPFQTTCIRSYKVLLADYGCNIFVGCHW